MNEFVSVNKMSKKQKVAYFKQRRNTWGINPITRKKKSKRIYNIKKVNRYE